MQAMEQEHAAAAPASLFLLFLAFLRPAVSRFRCCPAARVRSSLTSPALSASTIRRACSCYFALMCLLLDHGSERHLHNLAEVEPGNRRHQQSVP